MDFKALFDIPQVLIYLNTPGNGLIPKSHYAWRKKWEHDFYAPEGSLRDHQGEFIKKGKVDFARYFHCKTEEVFCTPSFTWAFQTLISGIPSHYRFLLLEEDYPSVNYPVIARGFKHDFVAVDENLEDRITQYVRTNRPDVFAFSLVQYISGLKIDLDFIRSLKQEFPEMLIIGDATQYLGTENFNFSDSGFDAIGGSGYKWLMAGFGNGFMLIKELAQNGLFQTAQSMPRPKEAFYAPKTIQEIQFETGHLDTLSFGTLQQSLLFLEKLGMHAVEQHIHATLNYAYGEFSDRGLLLSSIEKRQIRSTLINLQIDQKHYPYLLEKGLRCFPRGSGIRIGIHLYNDQQDIQRLLDIIDEIL